ncbi:MAG: histidinol dehydrogenase [Phaeodactylibacter sp.]|nr:histidinol dehydrogenase [Phaeodactylibacter sp.]
MLQRYSYPSPDQWPKILQRPSIATDQLDALVQQVFEEVRLQGDAALRQYTQQFDQVQLETLEVSDAEKREAAQALDSELKAAIDTALKNIRRFHEGQLIPESVIETMPGVRCWRKSVAIDKVGFYIPGGSAPLFSSVLMLGVPAELAGCSQRILCSPPNREGKLHPAIVYTAQRVGIQRLFKLGGIQAIAAMAFGTKTVPAVKKLFGPGNQYVDAAKQYSTRLGMAIDLPAGPSEVLVYADAGTDPDFIAADLLAQAEHGPDSQVLFVTLDPELAQAVALAVDHQLESLPRKAIAAEALAHSKIIVLQTEAQALELINAYAPEHMILANQDAKSTADQIRNAGSVFIGPYSPESVGDYASGTNHTLPTNGFARAYSGVSVDAFVKKITYQELSREGLLQLGPTVEALAAAEALEAHKRAVSIRLQKIKADANQ